ncbi:MAG: Fis family transcriptional regulator [Nitrosomonadales bacterium]|nr:Fis family transcriptional regulator [Nitrosomonadales bacterium]
MAIKQKSLPVGRCKAPTRGTNDNCVIPSDHENDIAKQVRKALKDYFVDLDGEEPSCSVYDMVMDCVEKPLIEMVLEHVGGNQTRAAGMLGINRNTLRKKMLQHGIV